MLGDLKKNYCNFVWVAVLDTPSAARFGELAIKHGIKHGIKLGVLPEAVHHSRNTR